MASKHTKLMLMVLIAQVCLACGPQIYLTWEEKLDQGLTFAEIIRQPQRHAGKMVYLGGAIVSTQNTEVGTQIEVQHLPLDRNMEPTATGKSEGRFLIMYPYFLNPQLYTSGKHIVVVGEIIGQKVLPLGETEYTYPVLSAKEVQLLEPSRLELEPPPSLDFDSGRE